MRVYFEELSYTSVNQEPAYTDASLQSKIFMCCVFICENEPLIFIYIYKRNVNIKVLLEVRRFSYF